MDKYHCRACGKLSTMVPNVTGYVWCEKRKCNSINCTELAWYICTVCTTNQKYDKNDLVRHDGVKAHLLPLRKKGRTAITSADKTVMATMSGICTSSEALSFDPMVFARQENITFFSEEHFRGRALDLLICQAFLGFTQGSVYEKDREYHMSLLRLCNEITRTQRSTLCDVIALAIESYKHRHDQMQSGMEDYVQPSILITPTIIRNSYLVGTRSILQNVPRPVVSMVDSNHSYVSVIDALSCLMAFNQRPTRSPIRQTETNEMTIFDSQQYQMIRNRAEKRFHNQSDNCIIVLMYEWSDDFQPNNVKDNRTSVWMKTVTFVFMEPYSSNIVDATFPISLGIKGEDHECVQERFAEELKHLRGDFDRVNCMSFYDGKQRRMIKAHAELFVVLNDQPERRGCCRLLGGNSNLHARFGYSADLLLMSKSLPSCAQCASLIRECALSGQPPVVAEEDQNCLECFNWDMQRHLSTKALTFDQLIDQVHAARNKVESGEVLYEHGVASLRLFCLTDAEIARLLMPSCNRHTWDNIQEKDASMRTDEEIDFLLSRITSPDLFEDATLPALWTRGVELHQHVEVPMHLLFLGIHKTVHNYVADWFVLKSKRKEMTNVLSAALGSFPITDWCKVAPYKDGWVSENYLAMARLMMWAYSPMTELITGAHDGLGPAYVDPHDGKDVGQWSKSECQNWLTARGITLEHILGNPTYILPGDVVGSVTLCRDKRKSIGALPLKVVREIVKVVRQSPDCPPIVANALCSGNTIFDLLQALFLMTADLMQTTVCARSIEITKIRIKNFLNLFHAVTGSLDVGSKKPKWIMSYNFVCLLNIPKLLGRFGPMRNWWEGGIRGEGGIQPAKRELSQGLRKNWQVNVVTAMLNNMSINFISGQGSPNDLRYRKYKDLVEVRTIFMKEEILCAVMLRRGQYMVCLQKSTHEPFSIGVILRRKGWSTEAPLDDTNGHNFSGMVYFKWELDDSAIYRYQDAEIAREIILLPYNYRNKKNVSFLEGGVRDYTAIDRDWASLSAEGYWLRP